MKKLFALVLLVTGSPAMAGDLPPGIITVDQRPAPDLTLTDMDGKAFNLEEARGGWVFVHFWASWCGPCRKEMPAVERLVGKMDSADLRIVLINTAEDDDTVFFFLAGVAPSLGSLMDRDGLVTEDWKPRGLPATYLVDPKGIVRYQALGGRPWDEPVYVEFLKGLTSRH